MNAKYYYRGYEIQKESNPINGGCIGYYITLYRPMSITTFNSLGEAQQWIRDQFVSEIVIGGE